jgi:hypothetical protein
VTRKAAGLRISQEDAFNVTPKGESLGGSKPAKPKEQFCKICQAKVISHISQDTSAQKELAWVEDIPCLHSS